MFVGVRVTDVDLELDAFNLAAFGPMRVQMIAAEGNLGQFLLHLAEFHAQIQQGAHEHVAADAAENIQIKSFQSCDLRADEASSLI
jgi:hypothetical protein